MNQPNDDELLLAFLSENVSGNQHDALMARLRSEPDLVRRMLDLAADEELLREWATGHERLIEAPWNDEEVSISLVEGGRTAAARYSPDVSPRRRRYFPRRFTIPAVATLLLAAVFFAWRLSLPTAVARVEHVSSTVGLNQGFGWRTVRAGESLRFEAGVVELRTIRGVQIVAEGPCDCRFDSAQKLTLRAGRIYADVPESGRGFQVHTPDGEIVDWGTRFGIEVRANQATEVHVFEGKVTTELANGGAAAKADLKAGQAVALSANKEAVHEIPLSYKFAQQAAPYAEHFAYRGGALAGQDGWFDSGLLPRSIYVDPQSIAYPGLAAGDGGMITVHYHQGQMSSPVGRRWHDRYFSTLIFPDDDFTKRLTLEPVTLISFGSLDGPEKSNIRLIARKSNSHDRQGSNFGLTVDEVSEFKSAADFRGFNPSLIVMRLGDDQIDLWVNPPSTSLGNRTAPTPDIRLPRRSHRPLEALWINDADNPEITWYSIDAIRGGSNWAEVTPRG